MGFQPNYQTEAHIFAKHILATKPDARSPCFIRTRFRKGLLIGLKDVLGADHAGMIVKEASYETTEPTVDLQVATLQGSGADVFVIVAVSKFAAQAIRKTYDLGWNATRYLSYGSSSLVGTLKPAGLDKSKGLITGAFVKDVNDPRWKDDPDVKAWKTFTDKYMSATEFADGNAGEGFQRGSDDRPGAQAMR